MLASANPNIVADAMKRDDTTKNNSDSSKPVDQEFWDFFNDGENQGFLFNCIRKELSGGNYHDVEDLRASIAEAYAKEGKRRPEQLDKRTLACFARRAVIDYKRRCQADKRGGRSIHISRDDDDFVERGDTLYADNTLARRLESREVLLDVLDDALKDCGGKSLCVVRAVKSWVEAGCSSDSWTEFLFPEEMEDFMKMKKGVSLAGKASPAFCAVKQILREILEKKGMDGDLSAF